MIKGLITDYKADSKLTKNLQEGLKILAEADFDSIPDGKHVFSDDIYMNVQTYFTKQDADYEAHREYIDIQYMIYGVEKIGVAPYNECLPKIPYDIQRDIEFLSGKDEFVQLNKGEYMILFPQDAHKPSICADGVSEVRKAVVKVRV